ncbi:hypothetical protein [Acidisphaera sp. L21]|uniref:hypothetical protein n=1 Tax=Acidisphaera sp. L21 TaxID=1641851 RepID=UPI00131DF00D|nr:hypothetical protein [Acidisphaera sp. L21]
MNFVELRECLGFLEAVQILNHIVAGDLPHPVNGFIASDNRAHWHRPAVDIALMALTNLRRPSRRAIPEWTQGVSFSRA